MNSSENSNTIDAIITWVDGSAPFLIKKKQRALNQIKNKSWKQPSSGKSITRFKDNNEIYFCIKGIRQNLPWIRKIYLVTDRQKPEFLDEDVMNELGVTLIDHQVIFKGYERFLPTFNSISIETALYRIPGLANRYIYFNDDVIPIRQTSIEDFFKSTQVIIRGKWQFHSMTKIPTFFLAIAMKIATWLSNKERSPHILAQVNAAELAGFRRKFFSTIHAPHPVHTQTLDFFFRNHPDLFIKNISFPFRHLDQFVSHPLAHHLEAAQGNMIEHSGYDCYTFNSIHEISPSQIRDILLNQKIKFICLQGFEEMSKETQKEIKYLLGNLIDNNNFQ